MNERNLASPPTIYLNAQELFLFHKILRIAERTGKYGDRAEDVALNVIKKRRQQKMVKNYCKKYENSSNRPHYRKSST